MGLLVLIIPAALTLVLPLLGILAANRDIAPYLQFPPKPVIISHPPFSPVAFAAIALFTLAVVIPFVRSILRFAKNKTAQKPITPPPIRSMPGWGKAAFICLACCWAIAWTRFGWMETIQPHTFFPLWTSWIICVNALVFRRSGRCPMFETPARFVSLFIISAIFWWIFEYLNRFVGNWHYSGNQYSAGTYFLLATLSFSTVLPAVESMKEYLLTFNPFKYGFRQMPTLEKMRSTSFLTPVLILSCALLSVIGIFPGQLFPLIWVCPVLILGICRHLAGRSHRFSGTVYGDFTLVAAYACAALVCGFFWEMFNFYSLARWQYAIPYVQVLHIFEMPILGYAGYLPFGLECGLIIDLVMKQSDF